MVAHRIRRTWGRGALGAIVLAATLAGCSSDLPTNNPTDVGIVSAFVADQNGNGVPNAQVYLTVPGVGGTFMDAQPTLSNTGQVGNVTFQDIEAGSSQIWVIPPAGYTGGGIGTAQTITVTTNETTEVRLTLNLTSG
jgi:hypothetical protein